MAPKLALCGGYRSPSSFAISKHLLELVKIISNMNEDVPSNVSPFSSPTTRLRAAIHETAATASDEKKKHGTNRAPASFALSWCRHLSAPNVNGAGASLFGGLGIGRSVVFVACVVET